MEKRTDKNSYTVIFAIAMVFIVGALLAYLASALKPLITENERLEKQQNILYAMGINNNDESSATFISTKEAPGKFAEYITEQIVLEVKNGKIVKEQTSEEYKAANNGQEPYLIDVKKQQANVKARWFQYRTKMENPRASISSRSAEVFFLSWLATFVRSL